MAKSPEILGTYVLVKNVKILNTFQELTLNNCLAIDACGKKTEQRILKLCQKLKITMVFVCTLTLISHLTFFPWHGNEKEVFIIVMAINKYENYLGILAPIFYTIHYMSYIVLWLGFSYIFIYVVYTTQHLTFQFNLLIVYLSRIMDNFTHIHKFELIHHETYQKTIAKRLKLCVIHHMRIKHLFHAYYSLQYLSLGGIPVITTLTIMSSVYFIAEGISPTNNYRIIAALFCSALMIAICATYGQLLTNESEKLFYVLRNCPWITWNVSNRKTFMLMLTNSMKTMSISFYNLIEIDVSLSIKLANISYKLLVLFINVTRQKQN